MTRAETSGRLELTASLYEELITHARSDHPFEVCALLAVRDGVGERWWPVRNRARSMTYYEMEPADMQPYVDIDQDDELDLGIFHSHTHTEAFPSATDVAQARWNPHAVYLIASLQDPDAPIIRAFDIVDDRITERVLTVAGREAPTGPR